MPPPIPEAHKGFQCEVLQDSVSEAECRLTTMRWKYPLIVHAEATRHRAFSRSVASNRAIPTTRIIQMVKEDPFDPLEWGSAQPGMQAGAALTGAALAAARAAWHEGRNAAVEAALALLEAGLHKQLANRVLMPYQWITEVVTATDDGYANFFALRCHEAAEPHMRRIAELARDAYFASTPVLLAMNRWHLPFVGEDEERQLEESAAAPGIERLVEPLHQLGLVGRDRWLAKAVSAARCARTSYRTHDGRKASITEDLQLYVRLIGSQPRHVSPTEHQARPGIWQTHYANFHGWFQHRLEIPDHVVAVYFPVN